MNNDRFCGKCGEALEEFPIDGYDTVSGKRNVEKICPKKLAGHYGNPLGNIFRNKKDVIKGQDTR